MNAEEGHTLLERAVEALRQHSLTVSLRDEAVASPEARSPAAWLRVSRGRCAVDYAAEVKGRLVPSALGALVTQLRHPGDAGKPPPLLITDCVTPPLAQQLRALDQQFADTAGNAYLDADGLFVFVSGCKLDQKQIALRASKGFPITRLKVLFALICHPELAAAPYRAIAAAAGVALGALPTVFADLQRDGSLIITDKVRRLAAGKRLLDEWAQAYALALRGKTLIGRYRTEHFSGWPKWYLNPAHARWGGEPGAVLLACDLQPSVLTLYGEKLPARLLAHEHLTVAPAVAYEHLVELRKPFWGPSLPMPGRADVVPAALIYADLLATGHRRCLEAAQTIYDVHLARTFPLA